MRIFLTLIESVRNTRTMRNILITVAILASASAYPTKDEIDEGCKFCLEGSKLLFQNLRSQKLIGKVNQTQVVDRLCQTLDDPKACMKGVATWWPKIVDVVFADEVATAICYYPSKNESLKQEPACSSKLKKWDCPTCKSRIQTLTAFGVSGIARDFFIERLSGPEFCENPDNMLTNDQMIICKIYVQSFIPTALQQIFGAYSFASQDVCHDVFYGVCPATKPDQPKDDPDIGCQFCLEGSKLLLQKLKSQENFGNVNQSQIVTNFCQTLLDPKGCLDGVAKWWPKIIEIIFADEVASAICHRQNNACPASKFEWDCDLCKQRIQDLAALGISHVGRDYFTGLLSGPAFCENPDNMLTDEEITTCQIYVQSFVPKAYGSLFVTYAFNNQDVCHYVFYGVCPAQKA